MGEGACAFQVREVPTLNLEECCVSGLFGLLALLMLVVVFVKLLGQSRHKLLPYITFLLVQIGLYLAVFIAYTLLSLLFFVRGKPYGPSHLLGGIECLRLLEIGSQNQIFLAIAYFFDRQMGARVQAAFCGKVSMALQLANAAVTVLAVGASLVLNFWLQVHDDNTHKQLYFIYSGSIVLASMLTMVATSIRVLKAMPVFLKVFKADAVQKVQQTVAVLVCSSFARVVYKTAEIGGLVAMARPLNEECASVETTFAVIQFFVCAVCCMVPEVVMLVLVQDGPQFTKGRGLMKEQALLSEYDRLSQVQSQPRTID